jgi:PGF-CTERM protein
MATVLAVSLIASVAGPGVGLAGANHPDDAPDLSEYADFRVNFPNPSDHYPGDRNPQGGSIEYFASGAQAFHELDAEEGVYIDTIVVHAEYEGEDWIDYSACDVPNTKAFGIDRGNDNSGTQTDEDLVSRRKDDEFGDDGLMVTFYEWTDIGGNPPYMAPEDAIVAAQGEGSTDGPCLTLTSEPGWYRIAGFMNGTVADNGPGEQPSGSAEDVRLELNSNNFLYVCECDSEEEARDQLGRPPNEEPSGEPTPTATEGGDDPTPTATEAPGDPTPTPTRTEGTGQETHSTEPGTETGNTGENTQSTQAQGTGDVGDENLTPSPGEGPGFGPVAALLALLATALLANRRR